MSNACKCKLFHFLSFFNKFIRILKKDKRTLRRMKTLSAEEFEKKSRNEMMLALFLYTFECISVTAFSGNQKTVKKANSNL